MFCNSEEDIFLKCDIAYNENACSHNRWRAWIVLRIKRLWICLIKFIEPHSVRSATTMRDYMKTINIYACETRAFANSSDTSTHSIQSYFNTIYFDYPNMLRRSHQHFFLFFFLVWVFRFWIFELNELIKMCMLSNVHTHFHSNWRSMIAL